MKSQVNPQQGYAIIDPKGVLLPNTVRGGMNDCKRDFISGSGVWNDWYVNGWRCKRVMICPFNVNVLIESNLSIKEASRVMIEARKKYAAHPGGGASQGVKNRLWKRFVTAEQVLKTLIDGIVQ